MRHRPLAASLAFGVLHAALLLAVALYLGYAVGPDAYTLLGLFWRYGGLVVVAALPVWLALRFRLAAPLVALLAASGYVLGVELTPPGPTFRDVAELERLAEPTGIIVVEHGLYIVHYMVNASVWVVGFLLTGLVEAAARTRSSALPGLPVAPPWLTAPTNRQAAAVAGVGGVLHALAMTWLAVRLGVTVTVWSAWSVLAFGAVGAWLLAAAPIYFLLTRRLFAPVTLLAALVLLDARAQLTASVDGPHSLYFGAWFAVLALFALAGCVEAALRRLDLPARIE
ncbi:hypothetical protein [Halocalculus aciditolerans]|uniref:Uncharacterized protein n=1 Tax=Halocalculus aciditolerans TaxID=1383812 RepID=A0A830F9I7_9EURY|nr:hypothetical protein [Halocalculus aciditolerans]GGL67800.1 hypothetical protein GCM10009039_27220 [Halocalculus aciditolerans]